MCETDNQEILSCLIVPTSLEHSSLASLRHDGERLTVDIGDT
jgi:hypothetical protein